MPGRAPGGMATSIVLPLGAWTVICWPGCAPEGTVTFMTCCGGAAGCAGADCE